MLQEEKNLLTSLITALNYQRYNSDIIALLEEIIGRLENTFDCTKWTDEGNLIYGALIVNYGDYGTSPRSGWFYGDYSERYKKELITLFKEELTYYKSLPEEMEDD